MRVRHRVVLPAVALATVIATTAVGIPALADSGSDAGFVSRTNAARESNGLRDYAVASDLHAVAQRWAEHMAATETMEHNPSYSSQICCWHAVGENVGVGPSVDAIHRAFMASSPHRANLLSSQFTQIGVGTAWGSDGRLYVDEVFRQPAGATPSSPPTYAPVQHRAPVATAPSSRPASPTASRSRTRAAIAVAPTPTALLRLRLAALRREPLPVKADPLDRTYRFLDAMRRLTS